MRDPFYLRGVEVAIDGVLLFGLFFLRFDLTTTTVAHFAYDAGLTRRRLRGEEKGVPRPQVTPATAGDLAWLGTLPIEGLAWETLVDDPASVVLCLRVAGQVVGVAAGEVGAALLVQGGFSLAAVPSKPPT